LQPELYGLTNTQGYPLSNEASSRQLLEDFIETHRLNDIFRRNVEGYFDAYAHRLAKLAAASPRPIIVGINGSQGSGKSTLSAYLSQMMPRFLDVDCHIISIDDFYLTRARRLKLASAVHPLLAIRGVPGTHEHLRLAEVLAAVSDPDSKEVVVPVFDKLKDDRTKKVRKIQISAAPTVVLLEGWCVGIPAQTALSLAVPAGRFEFVNDNSGVWRTYVNEQLKGPYASIFSTLDRLSVLRPPLFEAVFDWRVDQENRLVAGRQMASSEELPKGMSVREVQEFVENFRRLTCHAMEVLPEVAHETWDLQADRLILDERTRHE